MPLTKTPSLPLSPLSSLPSLPSPFPMLDAVGGHGYGGSSSNGYGCVNGTNTPASTTASTTPTTSSLVVDTNNNNNHNNNNLYKYHALREQGQAQHFFGNTLTHSTVTATATATTTTGSLPYSRVIKHDDNNNNNNNNNKNKTNVIIRSRFGNYYTTGNRIGSGTFAVVKKCRRKNIINQEFAVKIIEKKNLTGQELMGLKSEVKILQDMDHPSIIKVIDVFEDRRKVKIVLELCEGGDLFDQMLKTPEKRFDETKAAWITCKIAKALHYLHEHYVVHRDLKPENILFMQDGQIKITDFGLAHYLKLPPNLHTMHTCCGTPHYVAPEVLGSDEYSVQVDFWSLGVILYVMLSGYQPFNSNSIRTMYGMITRGQYRFSKPHWDHISNEAKSCVRGLMHVDPQKRLNYVTLCQHPFILKHVDLKVLEEEEKELLQKQHALIQSFSLLLSSSPSPSSSSFILPEEASMRCESKKVSQEHPHLRQITNDQGSKLATKLLACSSYPSNNGPQMDNSRTIAIHVGKESVVTKAETDRIISDPSL